jgi:hypothetical protein
MTSDIKEIIEINSSNYKLIKDQIYKNILDNWKYFLNVMKTYEFEKYNYEVAPTEHTVYQDIPAENSKGMNRFFKNVYFYLNVMTKNDMAY